MTYNVIIIGSGPAGLTAAIYLSRAEFKPLVLAGIEYGGQLMKTTEVENYPGHENGILGPDLIAKMIKQAERFGAEIRYEKAQKVNLLNKPFEITSNKEAYQANAIIISTGSVPRKLQLDAEKRLWGKGVSSCATCDGPFYKGKVVAVVGGGDSAMEEADFLTRFANKVYLIHRRDTFRASKIMQNRVLENPKIEVIYNTTVKDIKGESKVEGLGLVNIQTKGESFVQIDGLFLAIGYDPATELFKGQIEMDEKGYLNQKKRTQSSIEGVFIAGDVEDFHYRQAITAAGDGCKAALDAQHYLEGIVDIKI